jgi:hypothetical protein
MLIIGGDSDPFIPPADVQLTGMYYSTRPGMLPSCAHAIMLEAGWREAAEAVCG